MSDELMRLADAVSDLKITEGHEHCAMFDERNRIAAELRTLAATCKDGLQVDEMRADAERYRWLRQHLVNWCPKDGSASLSWHANTVLDSVIDAARSAQGVG